MGSNLHTSPRNMILTVYMLAWAKAWAKARVKARVKARAKARAKAKAFAFTTDGKHVKKSFHQIRFDLI